MGSRYNDLSREELIRLLEARDRRDATRFGLVWEANEIERDKALNGDFVALDLADTLAPAAVESSPSLRMPAATEFDFASFFGGSPGEASPTRQSRVFDPRELRRALPRKMEAVLREEAMREADSPDAVAHFLNVILAAHPGLLQEAQKAALAPTAKVLEADELPSELVGDAPLPTSPRTLPWR